MAGAHRDTAGRVASSRITPAPTSTATPTPSATPTPAPTTAASAAAPATPGAASRFGLSVGDTLPGLAPTELNRRLDDMKSLGIGWIRLDVDWNNIQPDGPTKYHWENLDRVVAAANARGLKLLPIITYSPSWARSSACPGAHECNPADPNRYAAFAAATVARYAPQGIHQWEIWNEPNDHGFWGTTPNAGAYTSLLRAAYPAIKRTDPSATVITGGLASTDTDNGNIPQLDFVAGMYAAGAKPYFDAIGYHPYSFPVPPAYTATWNAWSKMALNTYSIRSVMTAQGDAAKQIWITEYGAPTNGPGGGSSLSNYNLEGNADHVDEAYQAALATAFVQATNASPWAGPAFWYSYLDGGTSPETNENFFGLIRANGTHKPAYDAYRKAITGR